MRTNFAGLFLAVGMGLIVLLLGFGALSVAGLVSVGPGIEAGVAMPADTMQTVQAWCGTSDLTAESALTHLTANSTEAVAIANGDALFKANCVQCHSISERIVGPALAGITKRRSISWLIPWVRNSAKVVASGDEYAVKLYGDNGKQQMPSFPLSKKEIMDIIAYVEVGGNYDVVAVK